MKRKCESNTATLSQREMNSVEAVGQEEVRTPGLVRTLIADDDPFGLKTIALMLALEARFDLVGTASDGRQAVRKAFELRPELVLLDYRMPGLDGIQATRCIKGFKHPVWSRNSGSDGSGGGVRIDVECHRETLPGRTPHRCPPAKGKLQGP